MECGVPFCHHGCPLGNLIPDWNDLVYRDRLAGGDRAAAPHEQLPRVHRPALPRAVRGGVRARDQRGRRRRRSSRSSVAIVDRAWDEGWVVPQPAARADGQHGRRDRLRARPGSPARSSSRAPATRVTVFERDEAAGGLVRFGVPEFKIEKGLVERRVQQLVAEGVEFRYGVDVGVDVDPDELRADVRRRRRRDRLARAARPADPGPRARRRPLRDGLPLAGTAAPARPTITRRRQARRRDRRRRHRRRLRRPRPSRGRSVRDADRAARRAARASARRPHAMAALAGEAPDVVRPGGGRRARVLDLDDAR